MILFDILILIILRIFNDYISTNSQFQSQLPDVTVVAFLIFPTKTNNFNVESLRGHAVTKQLRDTINSVQQEVGKRMYDTCLK